MVASYPFDDNEHYKTFTSHSYSKSPDDDFFKFLAKTYADNHSFMFKMDGKACGDNEPTFHKGIKGTALCSKNFFKNETIKFCSNYLSIYFD